MRYLPILLILLIVTVLALGATISPSHPDYPFDRTLILPGIAANQMYILRYDPTGTWVISWRVIYRADRDMDGDVDLEDYAAFAADFTGPK